METRQGLPQSPALLVTSKCVDTISEAETSVTLKDGVTDWSEHPKRGCSSERPTVLETHSVPLYAARTLRALPTEARGGDGPEAPIPCQKCRTKYLLSTYVMSKIDSTKYLRKHSMTQCQKGASDTP